MLPVPIQRPLTEKPRPKPPDEPAGMPPPAWAQLAALVSASLGAIAAKMEYLWLFFPMSLIVLVVTGRLALFVWDEVVLRWRKRVFKKQLALWEADERVAAIKKDAHDLAEAQIVLDLFAETFMYNGNSLGSAFHSAVNNVNPVPSDAIRWRDILVARFAFVDKIRGVHTLETALLAMGIIRDAVSRLPIEVQQLVNAIGMGRAHHWSNHIVEHTNEFITRINTRVDEMTRAGVRADLIPDRIRPDERPRLP